MAVKTQEGMVFNHFFKDAKYVIRASYREVVNGMMVPHRGLRAEFTNHRFDSGKAQASLGWSDEERNLVEQYLIEHADFGVPRGMSLENHTIENLREAPVSIPALKVRCAAFYRDEETGESVQCDRSPADSEDFCKEHMAEVVAASQVPAQPSPLAAPDGDLAFLAEGVLPGDEDDDEYDEE
jgi:hypothetical protein